MRTAVAAVAVTALALGAAVSASAAAAAAPSVRAVRATVCKPWAGEPLPYSGQLSSVVALSACDVWAAGGAGKHSLVVHWNGRSWQQVATPLTHKFWSGFNGLSVPAPGDVWAVGTAVTTSGVQRTIALHRG